MGRLDLPPDLAAAARLGGEMGRRFAATDWAAHPLGPVDGWSAQTRAAVAVALTSRFPIVLWLGAEDLYLVYNDAYIAALGDKHPAALGTPGRQVWWDIWDEIGPMLRGVLETGEATWSDDLMLPLVSEGRRHERYFTFSYGPMVGEAGDVTGIFCAVTETTERVLAARRLHILNTVAAALMGTRTAADAVAAAIAACGDRHPDLPFVAVYLNDAATGIAELRGSSPSARHLLPSILGGLRGGRTLDGLASIVDDLPDGIPGLADAFGELCPQQALILPLADSGQGDLGALAVGLNPRRSLDEQYRGFCRLLADQVSAALSTVASYESQRRRADALADLDRAKTAFLTNVSHEFRTPLTLLLGPLEDAIAEAHDAAARDRLEMAQRNARRLLRLVNALLDFSRIEAGRAGATPVRVDLGALTSQIASSFTELCQRADIDLILSCRPAAARVDLAMWETIVLNLMSNAVKFTLHGSITVVVMPGPQTVRVQVIDTGIGVEPADLPRLFDRFYRASNVRGRSVEGTGVGLSLVRGLVELHNGTIRIDSEPGVGTTVTIELPADRTAAEVPPPPAALTTAGENAYLAEAEQWIEPVPPEQTPSADRSRPLVLVADDNPDMRRYLSQVLAPRFDTVVYADGKAALEGVRRHRPDLVLADVMMPGADGFQLVGGIRADEALAGIPVILLSARAGVEAVGDGLSAGADDYLTKPFSSADLVNRVQARLAAAGRQRAGEPDLAGRREAAVAALTAALAAAGSVDAAVAALTEAPDATLGATGVAIGLLDEDHLTVHYGGAVEPELAERYHVVALQAPVPMADVVVTGRPMTVRNTADLDARYADVVRDAAPRVQAAQVHPLRDGNGSVIGALALLWPLPQEFSGDQGQLEQLATVTGTAMARIRTADREHRIATDFQEQLLDLDITSTAVVVSAVYQPATEAMRVGGDWYLVTPLQDHDRVAVSVGDVVGNGLPAATVMSRLRAATASTALTDADPVRVLTTVQRYAATVPGARCCTLAYAVADRRRESLEYICAGHPYPLLITPDGDVRYLDGGREASLDAFGTGVEGPAGYAGFPPGSMLILYTDGLIERRGESLDDGLARLAAVAGGLRDLPAGMITREIQRRLAPPGGFSDDVVILVVRPTGATPTSLVAAFPAEPASMRVARHALSEWLGPLNLPRRQHHDIILSVGEAVSNAIRHGSGRDPAKTVSLEVFAGPDRITATVTDSGRWTADSSASRRETPGGRGLTLMHGLSDRVVITRGTHGTLATLHYHRAAEPAMTADRR